MNDSPLPAPDCEECPFSLVRRHFALYSQASSRRVTTRRAGASPGGWKNLARRPERLGLWVSAPQERDVVRGAIRSRSQVRLAARRQRHLQARCGSIATAVSMRRRPELRRVVRTSRAHRGRARTALPASATRSCGASRAPVSLHHSHSWCDERVSLRAIRESRAERPSVPYRRFAAAARLPSSLVCCNGVLRCRPASRRSVRRGSAERLGRPVGGRSHRTEWPSCPYDKWYPLGCRTRVCEV